MNGQLYNGRCACHYGWSGNFCDRIICYQGHPVETNTACICPSKYRGEYCEFCTEPSSSPPPECRKMSGQIFTTTLPTTLPPSPWVCLPSNYSGPDGVLLSPGFSTNLNYGRNLNCMYHVTVPAGYTILLTVNSFETEEYYDNLYIYDGPNSASPLLAEWSGTFASDRRLESTGNTLTAKFVTDGNIQYAGFSMKYSQSKTSLSAAVVPLSYSLSYETVTEISGKTVTLASDQSSVEFDRIEWDPKKKLTVALRLATHSTEGQLMMLKGVVQETDETGFELSLEIKQRALNVYLYDIFHAVIAQSENVENDIATGEEESLVLELNLEGNALSITRGRSTQARIPIEKQIPTDQKMDVTIYLGAAGDETSVSIVGCVTLVSVYLDAPITFAVKTQSEDVVDNCKDSCDGFDCNGGSCINEYSRAVCDCFETGHHGAQCQTASVPVAVTSEQFIRYALDQNESQPDRIAFSFKAGKNVDEGLLLHAAVKSEKDQYTGILSMELINDDNNKDSINFRITDLVTMDFPDFPKGEEIFHDVVIKFFYEMHKVQVRIDGEEKTAKWEMEDPTDRLIFSEAIYFGGSADEGANGIGLAGCLNEPYVGRVALITHLNSADENSKVTSNGILSSCYEAAANDVASEEPSELTTKKVDSEEADMSVENEPTSTTQGNDYDSFISTETEEDEEEKDENYDNKGEELTADKKNPAADDLALFGLFALTGDFVTEEPPLVTCQPPDQMNCQNGGTCMNYWGKLSCACNPGFIGLYCQFSDLPRSCQEAYDLGERAPGVYQIDVDGNGPLRDTYVLCEDGVSIVAHNMPNGTIGRSYTASDQILPLTYRLFSPGQLGLLVKRSSECVQYLRYDCSQAPLQ
uniref:Uncharacterized protein n=1 Tax=Plectus sambesii TaxID=2011161 RepID=A0A914WTB2_9BILA